MSSAFVTTGPALPEPIPGHPVDQPIRTEGGNPPQRVKVHVELGIPIFFDPASAVFSARVGSVQGKGSSAELHSADFAMVVERIRQRALVTPVQGYLVSLNYRYGSQEGDDLVVVRSCTVIEHHPRRYQPFVVRVAEPGREHHSSRNAPLTMVERIRSTSDVLLPEPEHLDRVRAAQRALLDEEARHEQAKRELADAVRDALDAIPRLTARDLKYVQESRRQVAQTPDELGVVVYDDLEEDDSDADEEVSA